MAEKMAALVFRLAKERAQLMVQLQASTGKIKEWQKLAYQADLGRDPGEHEYDKQIRTNTNLLKECRKYGRR